MDTKTFKFECSEQDLLYISMGIKKLPYEIAEPILKRMQVQFEKQEKVEDKEKEEKA